MSKKRLSIVIPVISWCCTKNDYDSFDIYIFIIISNVIIILKTFDIFLLKGNCINFQTVSTQVSFECCTDNSINMVRYAYMCDILFVLEIPTWLCFSPVFCLPSDTVIGVPTMAVGRLYTCIVLKQRMNTFQLICVW